MKTAVKNFLKKIKKAGRHVKRVGLKVALKDLIKLILKKGFKVRLKIQRLSGYEAELGFADVLFIDGCGELLPHPARYRVDHQMEQLKANGMVCEKVYYPDLTLEHLKFAHSFVFFRTPETELIKDFIQKAKALNKSVIYDIDDLVIDTVYTDTIPYVQGLDAEGKKNYDSYVNQMGDCLKSCDAAITTTEGMAKELKKYVPEVFINRNCASQRMVELSKVAALKEASRKEATQAGNNEIRIGYFSGSITHNADYEIVKPILLALLEKYENLKLYIIGILDIPKELEPFKKQIVTRGFVDWETLPEIIASVDINIAPIEQSIFNEAKSENKWVEAAIAKVPTVASRVGAFEVMIEDGVTGLLVDNDFESWMTALEHLITDRDYRKQLAENAYAFCLKNCMTLYTGGPHASEIKRLSKPSAAFLFPSTGISGGIMVALKHAGFLQDEGFEVTIFACEPQLDYMEYDGRSFPVVPLNLFCSEMCLAHFDKVIATMWITPEPMLRMNAADRYYLVQNYETDFYEDGDPLKIQANATYCYDKNVKYITISKWCEDWLKTDFNQESRYAPNGIDTALFTPADRDFSQGKIRILIEGDSRFAYKGVDESFKIIEKLDPDRFEAYYLTYTGITKEWYKVGKLFTKVPYEEIPDVYKTCHILLKSSTVESFSYPPLEMMATGGFAVVAPNGGNVEYLKDGENCLMYPSGDLDAAVKAIYEIADNAALRETLQAKAKATVESRDWKACREAILKLYDL